MPVRNSDWRRYHFLHHAFVAPLACAAATSCDNTVSATEDSLAEPATQQPEPKATPLKAQAGEARNEEPAETSSPCFPDLPPLVEFLWVDVPGKGDAIVMPSALRLKIHNVSDGAIHLQLDARVDDGGQGDRKLDLDDVALSPAAETLINLDLTKSGLSISEMIFSGRAHVTAAIYDDPDKRYLQHAISSPVFYHPVEGGKVAVYTEHTLRAQHRSGDFAQHESLEPGPGVVIDRVIFGGAGRTSDKAPLQPEVDPEP